MRHTHITTLLQRVGKAGAKAVSRRAGHANLSTTLEVYQTVFEEDDRALADLSAGLFNRKLMCRKVSRVQFRVQFAVCSNQVIDNAALLAGSLVNRALTSPHLW